MVMMVEEEIRNSMMYWFPLVKYLSIPQPKTRIIKCKIDINEVLQRRGWDTLSPKGIKEAVDMEAIKKACDEFGYPIFLRTDHTSHKHGWESSCYVASEEEIIPHIQDIIGFSTLASLFGIPITAFVIRKYIELDWKFKAFHGRMLVARERRYFIKDGEVVCHHPYWIEGAIADWEKSVAMILEVNPDSDVIVLPADWREILRELNTETDDEIELLTGYAKKVAEVLDGYWSVDFAYAKEGRWLMIDLAKGDDSWHPEHEESDNRC